jgi:hypothetical protein
MKGFLGLLLLVFAFLNLNCRGSFKGSPITSDQWQMFSYIPGNIKFVAYFDFDSIRNTKAWNNILKPEIENQKFYGWLDSLNQNAKEIFNKEISKIVITKSRDGKFFILAVSDNPFNIFFKTLEDTSKFKYQEFLGERYLYDVNDESVKIYKINDGMIIITNNSPYLKNIIEQKQYSLDRNSTLIKLIEEIPDKTQYWFAMNSNELISEIHNKYFSHLNVSGDYNTALKRIQRVGFCTSLDDKIQTHTILSCWGDKSAYLIASGLKSAIAMNVFSQENYYLGRIMEKAEVNQVGKQIILTAELDKNDIDQVEKFVNNNLLVMNFN